ncbi:MAG: TetR/AcrR family transcriptional regulator [Thermoplasmatota archaeon]
MGVERPARASKTRAKILDAALREFAAKGYAATTTRRIAERAGVNEVTIFRHFGSKRGLFLALVRRWTDLRSELSGIELEPSGDVAADLARFGSLIYAILMERRLFMRLMLDEVRRNPRQWRHVSGAPFTALDALRSYFERARRKGLVRSVDPYLAALGFLSFFVRSVMVETFLGRDAFITMNEATIRDFARLYVDGLRRKR